MLGTPTSAPTKRALADRFSTRRRSKLTLLDITQSTDQIINLVSRYPGLLGCPSPRTTRFHRYRHSTLPDAQWTQPPTCSRGHLEVSRAASPIPCFMAYVAGCQPVTVIDYQLTPGQRMFRPDLKRLNFIRPMRATARWPGHSGAWPGVPLPYVDNTAHDMLRCPAQA